MIVMQALMEKSREKWDSFSNPVSKLITAVIVRQTFLTAHILHHVKKHN